jgi:S-formylglutathione hydrolase FrmB
MTNKRISEKHSLFLMFFCFILLLSFCENSSAGTVTTESFYSTSLQKTITYDVYLPNVYTAGQSQQRYPVIYLLHWYSGNKNDWQQTGIQPAVDTIQAIAVAPSDGITTSWWMDSPKIPSQKYCTFLATDLKKHIDSLYRTEPAREKTGICGVSMGGYGALNALRRHPDVYGAAFSIVGGVSLFDITPNMYSLPDLLGTRGSADSTNWIEADPVRNCTALRGLEIGINSNTVDGLYDLSMRLHTTLTEKGIEHTWWTFGLGHTYPNPTDMLTIMKWFQSGFSTTAVQSDSKAGLSVADHIKGNRFEKAGIYSRIENRNRGIAVIDSRPGNSESKSSFGLNGTHLVKAR